MNDGLISRLETIEQAVSQLEDISIDTTFAKTEEHGGKNIYYLSTEIIMNLLLAEIWMLKVLLLRAQRK